MRTERGGDGGVDGKREKEETDPLCFLPVVFSPTYKRFYFKVNSIHGSLIIHVVHYPFPGVFI